MTHKEQFEALIASSDLVSTGNLPNKISFTVDNHDTSKGATGYAEFTAIFSFDTGGKFINLGLWE